MLETKPLPPLSGYTDSELLKLFSVARLEEDRAAARAELVRRGRAA